MNEDETTEASNIKLCEELLGDLFEAGWLEAKEDVRARAINDQEFDSRCREARTRFAEQDWSRRIQHFLEEIK